MTAGLFVVPGYGTPQPSDNGARPRKPSWPTLAVGVPVECFASREKADEALFSWGRKLVNQGWQRKYGMCIRRRPEGADRTVWTEEFAIVREAHDEPLPGAR